MRDPRLRAPLLELIGAADELVVLGDLIELRERPTAVVLEETREALAALGDAAAGKRVTIVPGNHDHALLGRWLDGRRVRRDGGRLGVAQRIAPDAASDLALAVAQALAPAQVELAYPGVWLRDDVYAHHGHYLDRHLTVPSFECLGIRLVERLSGPVSPDAHGTAEVYEQAIAPVFALLEALAQRASRNGRAPGAGSSSQVWRVLVGPGRPLRHRLLSGAAFPAAVAALNAAGLGPLRAELSGVELRRSALRAMRQVVATLAIDARHVLFGHTHRTGPLPGDDRSEWQLPGGTLMNTGSWVFEPAFAGDRPGASPYWPGTAIEVPADGAPRLHRLLDDRTVHELGQS